MKALFDSQIKPLNNKLAKQLNVLEPSEGLVIKKGQLVLTPQLLEGLQLAESLQKDLDTFYGSIKNFLEVHKCQGGESDQGYVKLSPQRRLYGDDTVKPRFLKTAINTAEVRRYQNNHGQLPTGVTEKTSNKLLKKLK